MKRITYLLFYLLISSLIYSCSKDDNVEYNKSIDLKEKQLVIRERPSQSFLLSNKKGESKKQSYRSLTKSSSILLKNEEYLGRSYDLNSLEFGTAFGIRFPVINMENYLNDYPNSYFANSLNASEAKSYSFSSFNRYEEKTNSSHKVSAGFSLDLGIFSLGAKNKFESAFSSVIINESEQVYGELNINIMDVTYRLLTSINSIDNIKREYLESSFLEELYNSSHTELIDNFGGFVLTDYITGGRATVLYTGRYTKNSSAQTKETSMDNSIETSFSFSDYGAGADFSIGNSNGSSVAMQNNIESFYASAKTYGGNYGLSTFTIPKSIDDININLAQWASSLNDSNNNVLIDINDNGLKPISDFLIEDNFKYNINKILSESSVDADNFQLREPIIETRWRFLAPGIVSLDIYLVTRFGDKLQIANREMHDAWDEIGSGGDWDSQAVKNYVLNNFQEELNAYNVTVMGTNQIGGPSSYNSLGYKTSIANIVESNMEKYYDSNNGIMYLLNNQGGDKIAYSIKDDYVLDTYGMRSWVESLSTVQLSYRDLKDYEIIGL